MLTTEQMVVLLKLKNGNAVTGWALVHSLGNALPYDRTRRANWLAESLLELRRLGFITLASNTKSDDFRTLMYRITAVGHEFLSKTIN